MNLHVVATLGAQRGRQRAGGAATLGIAATGHVGLGHGLRLGRRLWGAGSDQDHFEWGLLKHPFESGRVHQPQRQQRRMQHHRRRQRQLQGAQAAQVHGVGALPTVWP
ncbi:MAG: hypothetical protein RIS90_2797, partial [Pseudomonadota bacterium]